jgi:hypothetical protein
MARKINPLSLLSALDKFLGAIPEGFTLANVIEHEAGARLCLTASADAVRAAFPAARTQPGYSVGEIRVEGSAEIYDGERRLSMEVSATETVPTVERVLSADEDIEMYHLGVWAGGRRLWTLKGYPQRVQALVRTSDIPALIELGVRVETPDTAEAAA